MAMNANVVAKPVCREGLCVLNREVAGREMVLWNADIAPSQAVSLMQDFVRSGHASSASAPIAVVITDDTGNTRRLSGTRAMRDALNRFRQFPDSVASFRIETEFGDVGPVSCGYQRTPLQLESDLAAYFITAPSLAHPCLRRGFESMSDQRIHDLYPRDSVSDSD